MERILILNPEIFRYLYDKMEIGVVLRDRQFNVIHANPSALAKLGMSLDEYINLKSEDMASMYFNEDGESLGKEDLPYKKALETGEAVRDFIINIRQPEENISRWITGTAYPVFMDDTDCAVLATFVDVTEKRRLSESLERSEEFLQIILENSPQSIFWKDTESVYQGCNSRFSNVAGVGDPENIIGKTDFDLAWKKEEAEAFRKDDRKVMDEKKSYLHIIEPQKQADGSNAWIETNKVPLFDTKGDVNGLFGTYQHITELIKAREKISEMLRTENERLERLVLERTSVLEETMSELMKRERMASLGSLVAGVSHEINTPLGVSISASSYLKDRNMEFHQVLDAGELSKEGLVEYIEMVNETTEIININLERAARLVRSFKDISTNLSHEETSRFDLHKYAEAVILTLKHEYKRDSHKLVVSPDKEFFVEGYPSAYSQILTNLIMNSLHHAFLPDVRGLISISLEKNGDTITITFTDNGKGIGEDIVSRIFDPFFTTNRENGGSGLGLNIVYNIVTDQLNGTVSCESTPGNGCSFIIKIPVGEIE